MPIDYKQYPANWKTEIRPAILERANNCCEVCGVENGRLIHRYGKGVNDWDYWPEGIESEAWSNQNLKSTKVCLTIAHLDHDKLNHGITLDRLQAMCQKCHLQYDIKHHFQNRKQTIKNKKGLTEIQFPE